MIQVADDVWINPALVMSVYHCGNEWRVFTSDSTEDEKSWFLVKEEYLDNFLQKMKINRYQ
jgi:hypothetical protein